MVCQRALQLRHGASVHEKLCSRKAKEEVETENLRLCTIKTVTVFEDGEWETLAAPHMPATKSKSKGKEKEERGAAAARSCCGRIMTAKGASAD